MRAIETELLSGSELYREVVLRRMAQARESVFIATANVKAMHVDLGEGQFGPILELFSRLAARGVSLRLLHAELPSRPFRAAFDARRALVRGGLELKICPRVHFKAVLVDGAWVYLGSANLTGAGLGSKSDGGATSSSASSPRTSTSSTASPRSTRRCGAAQSARPASCGRCAPIPSARRPRAPAAAAAPGDSSRWSSWERPVALAGSRTATPG
jgi:hypothetical protein